MNEDLLAHIEASFERNEISKSEQDKIMQWICSALERADDSLTVIVLDQVSKGLMELVGWDGKQPTFRVTAAGMAYVRRLMKTHGASSPSELLGLPPSDDESASLT